MNQNGLTANALSLNALTSNALTSNALSQNALTSNALSQNALTARGEAARLPRSRGDLLGRHLRRACLSPGKSEIPRVCGPSIEGCVMDVVGTCDDVCEDVRKDGAFTRCGGERGERADITVFLQQPGA
ncbi:MAG TPA: hypothetical protein VHW23_24075 [Kofleriaceae bacterium]|nr:hypothetical protein [Kofleriaceae bacterium]